MKRALLCVALLACDEPTATIRPAPLSRILDVGITQCLGHERALNECVTTVGDTMYVDTYYVARVRWQRAAYLTGAILWPYDATKPCPTQAGSECLVGSLWGPFSADTMEHRVLFLLSYVGTPYSLRFTITDNASGDGTLDTWRRALPVTAERGQS